MFIICVKLHFTQIKKLKFKHNNSKYIILIFKMALCDESFYTNIFHGIPNERKNTIKDNIIMLHESSNILNNADNVLSFASIFAGPIGKTGSFVTNKLVSSLDEAGAEELNKKVATSRKKLDISL